MSIDNHFPEQAERRTIPRRRPSITCPLSSGQERLWFLHQLEPGSPRQNVSAAFRLAGPLDVDALERSVRAIVERHEVLRTTISVRDGKPVQSIRQEAAPNLARVDLESLPEHYRETEMCRLAQEEATRPFDLSRDLMLRACVLRLAKEEHLLVLTMHHIACDGWSRGVLLRELSTFYRAFLHGQPPSLSGLPIQYADHARWQREVRQSEVLKEQLAYWRRRLEGAPPVLELPTDRPRPAVRTHCGAMETVSFGREMLEALRALARREDVTLFMVLLAALSTLLSRYTAQPEVIVGSPTTGRARVEVEGLIGFFSNLLVLRTDLTGNPTVRELLARTRKVCSGAYAHQDIPFDELVEALQPERKLDIHPLFQVEFELYSTANQALALPDLTVSPMELHVESSPFDLRFRLNETAEDLEGAIEYATDLFDRVTIQRWAGHFHTLLEGIVDDPDARLSELPLLTTSERHQMLVELNDTKKDYPRDACIHELFEAQVKRTPNAVAIVFEEARITYDQLNRRANQLAHCLRSHGVGPDTLVGIWVERSIEMAIGVLGILKAGGAYVPLDPNCPLDRLTFMLEDSQLAVLLTRQQLAARLSGSGVAIICLDADGAMLDQQETENHRVDSTTDNLGYVIYTSGSTGRPKGVLVEQKQVLNYVQGIIDRLELMPGASFAMVQPLAVDSCVTVIFPPLFTGGCLHVIAEERAIDPEAMSDYFSRHRVDYLKIAPSHLAALQTASQPERVLPRRTLIIGGEASRRDWAEQILAMAPDLVLFNHYGPTEATVGMLTHRVKPETSGTSAPVLPLGHPLPNTQAYVLDQHLQPVPVGVRGELHIGGDCLARGYLNRPDLTSRQFIPHPFSKDPGARLYKSGDLARYRADGSIEFLGRIDHQLKIRGQRVEPGEIEAVLSEHPDVREVVVSVREDRPGDQRLVAYVVPREARTLTDHELREFMVEKLPDSMVPSRFMYLKAMPRTPHGKLDRRALPAPDIARPELEDTFVAPSTPAEQALARIWTDILGLDRVGLHDNFFELGGHSLLATLLISRVRTSFQVDVPLRGVFESPTVAGMAVAVTRISEGIAALPTKDRARPRESIPRRVLSSGPPSYAQERLWFLNQLEPDSPLYNVSRTLRLGGRLDLGALRQALDAIIARHDALRTTFHSVDGRPVQTIAGTGSIDIEMSDVSECPVTGREAAARQRLAEEVNRPFDLSSGPLLRASVVRLEDDDHLLILVIHHIVSDGWSMGVLLGELSAHYEASCAGEPPSLSELPIQCADYARWQREWLHGEVIGEQLAYWKRQLDGAPSLSGLRTDRPHPPRQTHRGAREWFVVDRVLSEGLMTLGRREEVSLFMTLLAAFSTMLSHYASQDDIVVGSPTAGRTRTETEGLIGFFVNTLVLRTDLSGNPGFRTLLGRVKDVCLDAHTHQDMPFERLVEEFQTERHLRAHPLFQIWFVLHNTPSGELTLPGLSVKPVEVETGSTQFDLTLAVTEQAGGLRGVLEYNTDLFDRATIQGMAGDYHTLLEAIVDQPDARLSDLRARVDSANRHRRTRKKAERMQTNREKLKQVSRQAIIQPTRRGDDV